MGGSGTGSGGVRRVGGGANGPAGGVFHSLDCTVL